MSDPLLRVRRLSSRAVLPQYASPGASGLDLYAPTWYDLEPGTRHTIPLEIAIEIPEGYEGQIRPRSGLAHLGVTPVLGTIDADYRGEIKVTLDSRITYRINTGDRIAQLVIVPVARVTVLEMEELTSTSRGEGGFGSTGK